MKKITEFIAESMHKSSDRLASFYSDVNLNNMKSIRSSKTLGELFTRLCSYGCVGNDFAEWEEVKEQVYSMQGPDIAEDEDTDLCGFPKTEAEFYQWCDNNFDTAIKKLKVKINKYTEELEIRFIMNNEEVYMAGC